MGLVSQRETTRTGQSCLSRVASERDIAAVAIASSQRERPLQISGTYQVRRWDEKPYDVIENRVKTTKASVEYLFSGDIEGTAGVEYLMCYTFFDPKDAHNAIAQYVGLVKFAGKLKGKSGSFAMADNGKFESGVASSDLTIIPNSGTGELSKITGTGRYRADKSSYNWEMDVTL